MATLVHCDDVEGGPYDVAEGDGEGATVDTQLQLGDQQPEEEDRLEDGKYKGGP